MLWVGGERKNFLRLINFLKSILKLRFWKINKMNRERVEVSDRAFGARFNGIIIDLLSGKCNCFLDISVYCLL